MNRQFSLYLDFIRFIAATFVFISHVPSFSGGWFWQLGGLGHEAVVIFFVLSGFVISYVVYEKKESALKYASNRLARIYSVAIPALLLTLFLYYVGKEINSSAFDLINIRLKEPVWTFVSAVFFINQSWVATPVFSNLPYWSLGYEVLYYIFFGIFVYLRGNNKIILVTILCLIMGPSIILYLPIWFAGVICFKYLKIFKISFIRSLFLYLISLFGMAIFSLNAIQSTINNYMHSVLGNDFYNMLLEPAEKFSSDYVLAIFVTLHIFSSYHLIINSNFFNVRKRLELIIREASSHTFSLYLFHLPMLYFISAALPYKHNPFINMAASWIAVPYTIFLISSYTENKKHRYQEFFESYLVRLKCFKK
jgi:peptidoglycan/LPS O-acetylase OafA/YrhL